MGVYIGIRIGERYTDKEEIQGKDIGRSKNGVEYEADKVKHNRKRFLND